ncbi:MAG: trigger factor [Pseudomonadales bacterium]|nr:trigger factor [Pseudomonadales bacterium]
MQVSVEATTGLERRLTVGIPAEEIDDAVLAKLKETAKQVRLDGFRPGKVPVREVKRRFGASVRAEVVGDIIQRTYFEAVSQENLQPAGMPKIEPKTDKAGSDLEYVAIIEVYPEIKIGGLDQISVTKITTDINDADVDEMIETLRGQRKEWIEKEGEAVAGSQVIIDYVGTKDGELFEGGSGEGSPLELGSKSMIPGFEDGILGAKAGDEKILDLTFPEDYNNEELRGQAVQFKVTVKKVNEASLPELNEAFYKNFGVTEGGEVKFREEIKNNMARELKSTIKNKLKTEVMDGILANNEFDVPSSLIDGEIDRQRQAMFQQFGGGQNLDPNMLPAELFKDQAERSVKLGLALNEIIKTEDLTADADKVKAFIEEMASTYEKPEELINHYYSNQEQLQQIESVVLEDQVIDSVMGQAKVTEKVCSYEELMKPETTELEAQSATEEGEVSEP